MTDAGGKPRPLDSGFPPALRAFVGRTTLFAFDLDGTLAPIVPVPSDARIPDHVRDRLAALCRHAKVAILTGRSVRDTRVRLGFVPHAIVGNHGAEGLPGREAEEAAFARLCREWVRQLGPLLREDAPAPVFLEDKGVTLAVHYRAAPDPGAARVGILRAASRLRPAPATIPGKFVENLVPPGSPRKGEALLEVMRGAGAGRALFVGDDETDEAVFRLADPRIMGIRVGCEESSGAQWCLPGQDAVERLLDQILSVVGGKE